MSRAEAFRNRNNRTIKLSDGCEVIYRTPSAFDLIECGFSAVLADVTLEEEAYHKKMEEITDELNKDLSKVIPIAEKLFARVFVDPVFHAGEGEAPENAITASMLGGDLVQVLNEVMNSVAGAGLQEAATAAARFREDADGVSGEPDRPALRSSADGDPRSRRLDFPPAPRDGFSGSGRERATAPADSSAK